ncbi:MAG: heme biosynthesis protein HemY [Alphaproteobacteria bacterium]|jgi:HemY protein|nr:heme biosynthesis protein HemY [Alphaproteobacteria bacterium]
MIRLISGIVVFALIVTAAAWLADRPGDVAIEWLGYRIDTTVGVLGAAVLILGASITLLYMLWRGLIGAPGAWFGSRSESRKRRGYRALSLGMVAVAAGDADEAQRQARRAESMLDDPPLTMLLSAQAAQLTGDKDAARRYFTAMLENPETAFLGVRGLLMQATRENNAPEALRLAEQAHRMKPTTPWVVQSLFDMQARAGQWLAAQETLQEALRNKVVPVERGRTLKAILLVERSRQAEARGKNGEATQFAREAFLTEPSRIPVAQRYGERLIADNDHKRVRKILERAWALHPHPDLAQLYLAASGNTDPLKRVQALQELTSERPDDVESHIVLAREALEARLWGQARRHLVAAGGDNPPARICRLMADLEESEFGDGERVRLWLTRATAAPIDRHWRCQPCGMVTERWQSVCPNCGAFGTIDWRSPPPGYSGILSLEDGITAEEMKAITVEKPPVATTMPVPVNGNGAAKKEDDKPLPPPVLPQRIDPLA